MAQQHQTPEGGLPPEPGLFSVVKEAAKDAVLFAAIGAAAVTSIALIASLFPGGAALVNSILPSAASFGLVAGTTGALLTAAATTGAVCGAVVGAPFGAIMGTHKVKHYYHDLAMPQLEQQARSHGMELGQTLEQQAVAMEKESTKFRDAVRSKNPEYAAQLVNEKAMKALAEMEPMGRA